MNYVGSKNRISKELKPIIESYLTDETVAYIEPFVGGANMIDKIDFHTKIGSDIHEELIELLNWMKYDVDSIPKTFTEEQYLDVKFNRDKYSKREVGLYGFCGAYGALFMSGFAKSNDSKGNPRDMPSERIRNIKKQSKHIQDISFDCKSYLEYNCTTYKNCVFYIDPPYKNTLGYDKNGKNTFNHDELYTWCIDMSKHNTVLISEYNMPEDLFECVWSKEVKVNINNQGDIKHNKRIEKLFKVRGDK